MSGFVARVLIKATLCLIPPDKLFGYLSLNSSKPYFCNNWITSFLFSSVKFPCTFSPIRQLSKMVNQGNRESFCSMYPNDRLEWFDVMVPSDFSSSPVNMDNNVLFPQPEGPTMATNSFSSIDNVIF